MNSVRVLLVEDDRIVALDTRRRLERLGHEVVAVVPTGAEAIDAAARLSPDVVLMDIGLAGPMDGVEAAGRIREAVDMPVVYLTAFEGDATLDRAKETEPQGYLLKPSTDREIQITLELAVYRHRAERERRELREKVRVLEGILPICSSCKKIRDDAGYWQQVEVYIAARSEAVFSHGICPTCMESLYPPEDYPALYGRPPDPRK